jgi:hypothetical protein
MTELDVMLLVGSAAFGMAMLELSHRTIFEGWIPLLDRGLPDVHQWTTREVVASATDVSAFLVTVAAPWTVLLVLFRMRAPRPSWRRIWREPGMTACFAALFAWCWSALALILAADLGLVARWRRSPTLEEWAQKYLSDEVFMYVGVAVATTWLIQYLSGRWRRSADWIDTVGRLVGVAWILIGMVWTLHEYLPLV